MRYSEKEIVMRAKQVDGYKEIPSGYWLCGVRSSEDQTDRFDDIFYLMKGTVMIKEFTGTTNPGKKILMGGWRKYNKNGAAVLASDMWYNNVWKKGKHKGRYAALLQRGAKVKVFRDGDNDGKSEEIGYVEWGWFGINFHLAATSWWEKTIRKLIGGFSAGCQVANVPKDYRDVMNKINDSDQELFSYCLLKEFSI